MASLPAVRPAPSFRARPAQLLIAAGLAASLSATASGALVVSTWASAASGTWNTAANWSPNANFPNNGTPAGDTYHAIISATGVDYIVTLSTSVTLDMLTLNSANALLSHTGGSFNPGVANISAGTYRLNGGTVSGGTWNMSGSGLFDMAANSSNLISNATINGDVILSAQSARTRISGTTRFDTARLQGNSTSLGFLSGYTLQDAISAEGAAVNARVLEMATPGTLTIGATGSVTHAAGAGGDFNIGGSQWWGQAMTLVNDGVIQMDASGRSMNIQAGSFTNNNDLNITNGTVSINNWANNGTVEMTGGALFLGAFDVTGGIGTWNRTGGTVNINGAITNPGSFTLDDTTGSWTLNAGSINGGTVNLNQSAQLLVGASTSNLLSNVDLNGDVILSAQSARTRISGTTRFDTARLQGNSTSLGFLSGYTLQDAISAEGAAVNARFLEMATPGTLTIGATGSVTHAAGAGGDFNIGGSQWWGQAMTLVNDGVIQMDASGRSMNIQAGSFTNNNDLNITNGTVSINNWANNGTVEMTGGALFLGAFDVTGGIGTWNRTGGTVNINGAITNPGSFTLDDTTGSWTLNAGSISGGVVDFGGSAQLLTAASSSNLLSNVDLNGDVILSAQSARTRISGTTRFDTARLQGNSTSLGFLSGYTLQDAISAEGAAVNARFLEMATPGTLTIGATGSVTHAAGAAGDFNIGGSQWWGQAMTLVNDGVIQMDASGRSMNIQAGSFTNNNDLNITNGTVSINNWANNGTVEMTGGALFLGAFDVTGGIGTWNRTGGTVNINGAITNPGSFTLDDTTGSWTLNAGSISGGVVDFGGSAQLLTAASTSNLLSNVDLNGDVILSAQSARTRISGTTRFDTARLQGNSTSLGFLSGYTLQDAISAEGAAVNARFLEMATAGTLTIGATGSVTHAAGAGGDFNIGGSQWWGQPMTLVNDGVIQMEAAGRNMSISGAFTNNGTMRVEAGTVSVGGPWTNTGLVRIIDGALNLGAFNTTGGIGTWNRTGGTVNINGAITNTASAFALNNSTGSWTLNGGSINGGTVNLNQTAQLLVGASTSNLLADVDVNGEVILSAQSARTRISGTTRFDTARLQGNSTSLGFLSGYTLQDDISAEGAAVNARFLEMATPGTLTIGATGSVIHAAGAAGDFNIGGSQWWGQPMTLVNDGVIQMDASGRTMNITPGGGLTNTGTLRVTDGTMTMGGGTWTNTTGDIVVSGGTLNLGAFNTTAGIGAWNRTGGTVNITGAITNTAATFALNNSTGSWTLNGGSINGGTVNLNQTAQLLVGASTSNLLADVDVNGEVILSAQSARTRISGTTRFDTARLQGNSTSLGFLSGYTLLDDISAEGAAVNARFLEMATPGTLTIGATGSVTHAAGAAGDFNIGGSQWWGQPMTLVNDGAIRAQASGRTTTILAQSFDNQGEMEARGGGTLSIDSSGVTAFVNNGPITAGTGGTVRFVDGYNTASSTGDLTVEIGGALVANYGRINVTGATAIDGADIELDFVNGFAADWGDKFTVLTSNAGQVTGDFSTFVLPTLTDAVNWRWYSEQTTTAVSVGVRHTSDINRDNSINFADLNIIVSNFNSNGSAAMGDVDGDGFIGFADLNRVLSFFNTSAPINTVPAPGGVALLAGLLGASLRRRR